MDVVRRSAAAVLVSLMAAASVPAYGQVFQPYPPVIIEESARLVIPDPAYPDTHDVAIDGNRIVVGAQRIEHEFDLYHDVAVLFERSSGGSWSYVTTLLEQDADSFLSVPDPQYRNVAYLFERQANGTWGCSNPSTSRSRTAQRGWRCTRPAPSTTT